VIAARPRPASSLPTISETRDGNYSSKMFGSTVLPDPFETMNRALARSTTLDAADLGGIGRIENVQLGETRPAGRR
jgi:hypothetical protein